MSSLVIIAIVQHLLMCIEFKVDKDIYNHLSTQVFEFFVTQSFDASFWFVLNSYNESS